MNEGLRPKTPLETRPVRLSALLASKNLALVVLIEPVDVKLTTSLATAPDTEPTLNVVLSLYID